MSHKGKAPATVRAMAALILTVGVADVAAGCGSTTQYPNCVDDHGRVVDGRYCDSNQGGYWIFMSTHRYGVGSNAPSNWKSTRFRSTDQAARSKAGLPKTGSVAGKSVTRGGGFGTGSGEGTGHDGEGSGHGAGS